VGRVYVKVAANTFCSLAFFETTLLYKVEQFQRRSSGALLTDLPFLYHRDTGRQERSKYRLTNTRLNPDFSDLAE